MDQSSLNCTITDVLARMPTWVRQDLTSRDRAMQRRAEETLAAAIAAALGADGGAPPEGR